MWNLQKLFISSILLLALDAAYIFTTQNLFLDMIHNIQYPSKNVMSSHKRSPIIPNITAVVLTYIFIIGGLNYFIIQPGKSPIEAFYLGIFVYSIYELTNMSILKGWKWEAVILDTFWGGVLFATTAYITRLTVSGK